MAQDKKETSAPYVIESREIRVRLPAIKVPGPFQGFVDFVREQGVVGLAIGLVLGVAAKGVVDSLVNNIFNPVIGLLTGGKDISDRYVCLSTSHGVCDSKLAFGQVISDIVSFLIVAAVVYIVVKVLKLEKLDKKKEK